MSPLPLDVRPLAPQRLADFMAFFDGDAFVDNPRWQSCYCQYLHVDHSAVNWAQRTLEQNRAAACGHIAAARMQGFLAYRDGRVVGWCNAAPRTMLQALSDEPDVDDAHIGQIGCFVVAKAQRRTGVASALLSAALAGFQAQGLRIAQGTPLRDAHSDAQQHLGPMAMYLAAGFRVHRERNDGTIVVRRELNDAVHQGT
jgi:GNAT superfamily N-acetyltransferase